jgi:hypothetical protein
MNLPERGHSLLRGIDLLGEFHDFRLYDRDALNVSLDRIDHRFQYPRRLSHVGQSYVFKRLPDLVGAVDASVIFSFQGLKSIGKVGCVLQIGGKAVRLDATNTVYVAYVGIMRFDDLSVIFDEGICLFQKRIKAADEVIPSSVATIQLNFAFRTR